MWRRSKTYRTSPVRTGLRDELNSTQAKITGFDLTAMQAAHVYLIGAGGIGSPVAAALTRKGVGRLSIIDDDIVELKNLTRQWYGRADIGKYKAHCLARNLATEGLFPTKLDAYPFRFQELLQRGHDFTGATTCHRHPPGRDQPPMEIAVADKQKNPTVQFVTETQSVRLANFSIRVVWKSTAGVIAVTARLFTAIILAIVGIVQRNRTNW